MTQAEANKVIAALTGLLKVAKLAMPDTYYATDRRVRYAERLLADVKKEREQERTHQQWKQLVRK